MLKIFLVSILFISCGSSKEIVTFKKHSPLTGFFELDPNGIEFNVLGNESQTFLLSSSPSVTISNFESLEREEGCYKNKTCVNFQLNEEGKRKYAELTKRNKRKQIFQVIDGKIIEKIYVMDEISGGIGQFVLEDQFFDSFFVVN